MNRRRVLAPAADAAAVRALLRSGRLPCEGPGARASGFSVARAMSGAQVGCAGTERHGDGGVLRSVAVDPGAAARRMSALDRLTTDAVS